MLGSNSDPIGASVSLRVPRILGKITDTLSRVSNYVTRKDLTSRIPHDNHSKPPASKFNIFEVARGVGPVGSFYNSENSIYLFFKQYSQIVSNSTGLHYNNILKNQYIFIDKM